MKAGVLALQGDFAAHHAALARAGSEGTLVRKATDLDGLDALVLPGGESTAMLRGIDRDGLWAPLAAFLRSGRPVLGTCAGAILLAARVVRPTQRSFTALDVTIERNAYGTQRDSFAAPLEGAPPFAGPSGIFIRAPRIVATGPTVEVLARVGGDPVLVRQGPVWAATFHPELDDDSPVLAAWLAAPA